MTNKIEIEDFLANAEKMHFTDRRMLPIVPAVYAITNLKDIFYIGSSRNLKNRCGLAGVGTHIMFTIPNIYNYYIAYIQTEPSWLLPTEKKYISSIQPEYNTYGKDNIDSAIHFRLPKKDREMLERLAVEEAKNVSDYIRNAINFYHRYKELVSAFKTEFINDL